LNAVLQANVSKRRKVFALFIDLSKAFDSIRHKFLWSKLHEKLHRHAKAKIRTQFGQSEYFPLKNSAFQGETLSPKLFMLFIEDIVGILARSGITSMKIGKADINILLYADDMIVLAYNCFDLQEKINILVKYFLVEKWRIYIHGRTDVTCWTNHIVL
jgi:hypothetical protein